MWIVLPLIILLIGLGAWRAWRRSPVSAIQTHFQFAGVLLLMVAAMVALTLAVFGGPASHSRTSHSLLLGLAVLLLLSGSIGVAFRITGGWPARLPAGVHRYDGHRRGLIPRIGRTGALLACIGGSALLVPSDWMALPLTLGGLILLLGGAILFPQFLTARRSDRGMTALLANRWVHWRYTPEQWQSWAAIQRSWERARTPVFRWRRDWAEMMFPISIMAAATWILAGGGPGEKVGVFLSCVAALLVLAGLLMWHARREPERRYRRMLAAQPETCLGAGGLCCGGEYFPWSFSGKRLVEAHALHDPPRRLVLTLDFPNRTSLTRETRLIPMPAGSEADLSLLQAQFRALYPEAEVHLANRCCEESVT